MKKILLSLAIIAVVSTASVGATKAYFSDSVYLTGITMSTGNADLKLTQIIMHQWFDGPVSYTGDWKTYASGLWSGPQWYPGLAIDDGFYIGNWSASHIGLTPTLSLVNYSQSKGGMDNAFELRVYGTGFDSGYQTINWWLTHPLSLPNIAWEETGAYGTHGTYAGTMSMRMVTGADNSVNNGNMGFDLHFDAVQTP
jgi:hypothetical protein